MSGGIEIVVANYDNPFLEKFPVHLGLRKHVHLNVSALLTIEDAVDLADRLSAIVQEIRANRVLAAMSMAETGTEMTPEPAT